MGRSSSSLNHALGFKKFGDMQIISESEDDDAVVSTPETSDIEVKLNLESSAATYCKYDFDLGVEKTISFGTRNLSNEVIFNNRIITDYVESIGNRVLSIDNISTLFSNTPRQTPFSVTDDFLIGDTRSADIMPSFATFASLMKFRRWCLTSFMMMSEVIWLNMH